MALVPHSNGKKELRTTCPWMRTLVSEASLLMPEGQAHPGGEEHAQHHHTPEQWGEGPEEEEDRLDEGIVLVLRAVRDDSEAPADAAKWVRVAQKLRVEGAVRRSLKQGGRLHRCRAEHARGVYGNDKRERGVW